MEVFLKEKHLVNPYVAYMDFESDRYIYEVHTDTFMPVKSFMLYDELGYAFKVKRSASMHVTVYCNVELTKEMLQKIQDTLVFLDEDVEL